MTDPNTPDTPSDQHEPNPAAPAVDPAPAQPEQPPADQQPEQPDTGGNAEAAKYRRRLRAAETAHQQLTQQLAAVEQQLVGRVMADERVPDIVWTKIGPSIDEFRDPETGQLDLAKLAAWAAETRHDLGLIGPQTPDPAQGRGPGGRPQPGLADAFRPDNAR